MNRRGLLGILTGASASAAMVATPDCPLKVPNITKADVSESPRCVRYACAGETGDWDVRVVIGGQDVTKICMEALEWEDGVVRVDLIAFKEMPKVNGTLVYHDGIRATFEARGSITFSLKPPVTVDINAGRFLSSEDIDAIVSQVKRRGIDL